MQKKHMHRNIILASGSPRRQELLKIIVDEFQIEVSHVNEDMDPQKTIQENVLDVARRKTKEVFSKHSDAIVIGADTIVVLDDEVLTKPENFDDGFQILKKLSGNTHTVYTAVSIESKDKSVAFIDETDVTFHSLTDQEIIDYLNTDEPYDKAGAYGIQGKGSLFIKYIHGDYYNVMGFPISRVYRELNKI